jgi:hypothetical protein
MDSIYYIILCSVAVGCVSLTITKSKIFEPVRDYVEGWDFISDLINCPYCISHWVSAGAYLLFRPYLIEDGARNFLMCFFLMIALATPVVFLIYKMYGWMSVGGR